MALIIVILLLILIALVVWLIANQQKQPTRIIIHHDTKQRSAAATATPKPRADFVPLHIKVQRDKYPDNPLCPKCSIPMLLYRRIEVTGSPTLWQCTKCLHSVDVDADENAA